MKKLMVLVTAMVLAVAFVAAAGAQNHVITSGQEAQIADLLHSAYTRHGIIKLVISQQGNRVLIDCAVLDSRECVSFDIVRSKWNAKSVIIPDLDKMNPGEVEQAFELKSKIEAILNPSASVELKPNLIR